MARRRNEVEMTYSALTRQTLKNNTHKKYSKDAKKYAGGTRAEIGEYTLPSLEVDEKQKPKVKSSL